MKTSHVLILAGAILGAAWMLKPVPVEQVRQAELLSLRWDALDLDRQQVTIRAEYAKNGKSRVLPLGDAMTATLRALKATATSELVFGPQHHFSEHYFGAVRKAKLVGVTIHCLRHSWASRLAESSGDLLLLQQLGGWSSLSMVQRYAHLREGRGPRRSARCWPTASGRCPLQQPHSV